MTRYYSGDYGDCCVTGCDAMKCVDTSQPFGETCCLLLQDVPEVEDSRFLPIVGNFLPNYTVSHLRNIIFITYFLLLFTYREGNIAE
jgi:hypothetical protein